MKSSRCARLSKAMLDQLKTPCPAPEDIQNTTLYSCHMTDSTRHLAFQLLDLMQPHTTADFSGLGLIFYMPPLSLPVAPLGDQSTFQPTLPVQGIEPIALVLASISNLDSAWHDGFHLIDAESVALTHLSQFFCPPLSLLDKPLPRSTPQGARYMAAIAGSRIPGVLCTALLSRSRGAQVFNNGLLLNPEASTP